MLPLGDHFTPNAHEYERSSWIICCKKRGHTEAPLVRVILKTSLLYLQRTDSQGPKKNNKKKQEGFKSNWEEHNTGVQRSFHSFMTTELRLAYSCWLVPEVCAPRIQVLAQMFDLITLLQLSMTLTQNEVPVFIPMFECTRHDIRTWDNIESLSNIVPIFNELRNTSEKNQSRVEKQTAKQNLSVLSRILETSTFFIYTVRSKLQRIFPQFSLQLEILQSKVRNILYQGFTFKL